MLVSHSVRGTGVTCFRSSNVTGMKCTCTSKCIVIYTYIQLVLWSVTQLCNSIYVTSCVCVCVCVRVNY